MLNRYRHYEDDVDIILIIVYSALVYNISIYALYALVVEMILNFNHNMK